MKRKPTPEEQLYINLECARKLTGMSQSEVGAYMDEPLTQQGYSKAIKSKSLSVHQLLEISRIVGVTMGEICGNLY